MSYHAYIGNKKKLNYFDERITEKQIKSYDIFDLYHRPLRLYFDDFNVFSKFLDKFQDNEHLIQEVWFIIYINKEDYFITFWEHDTLHKIKKELKKYEKKYSKKILKQKLK